MKASLIFKLPEEKEEFDNALNGTNYRGALEEVDNYLRSRIKYEDLDEPVRVALEAVRVKIREELE